MTTILALVIGFVLDAVFGDPRWLPHPVVLMGRAISALEPRLRAAFPSTQRGLRAAGKVLVAILVISTFVLTSAVLWLCGLVSPWLRLAVESWLSYQAIAACELRRQTMAVRAKLLRGDLPAARKAVSMVVGRETARLDEAGVARAAVETVAENASDGVIAPLVFLAVGGAPLGLAYKAVNTMDSMIGYKNERYLDFGRAAALTDDVVNWLPARFAGVCIVAAAPLAGLDGAGALRVWRSDRHKSESPNAAQTESAMAGALGIHLNGDATYFGKVVHKPQLGADTRPIEPDDIRRAARLMYVACALALGVCACARMAVLLALGRM